MILSKSAENRYNKVLRAWNDWHKNNLEKNAEEFIEYIFKSSYDSNAPLQRKWVVEIVAATLAFPLLSDSGSSNLRYMARVSRPIKCKEHRMFWDILVRSKLYSVVTTNYDILIERGLRHRKMIRSDRPGIYYGGLAKPQLLKGRDPLIVSHDQERIIELSGDIPLFKLHGSLNWSFEEDHLVMYQDMRPAFRRGGDAAIIPPLTEKSIPPWLRQIWFEAEKALSKSDTWVVCGYSLPLYDKAIREMFKRSTAAGLLRKIIILDPNSIELGNRFKEIAPDSKIQCLPGLPEGLENLEELINKEDNIIQ